MKTKLPNMVDFKARPSIAALSNSNVCKWFAVLSP